jgi:hypothetical protein
LGAARRPAVMNSHSAPQPLRLCDSAISRNCPSPPSSTNSLPASSLRPSFFASACARTSPATEHSSVMASAL